MKNCYPYNMNCNMNSNMNCNMNCNRSHNEHMNKSLAMAYVPIQRFSTLYDPMKALHCGTAFPELDLIFCGRRGR
jgi:hypothetical protein